MELMRQGLRLPLLVWLLQISRGASRNWNELAEKYKEWSTVFMTSAAKEKGAVCLDGSPSGFYFLPGKGTGENRWLIYFQGGGWCWDGDSCINRPASLRSSNFSGESHVKLLHIDTWEGGMHGLFSSDAEESPHFWNWNKAFVFDCDGGFMSGDVAAPTKAPDGSDIFFRGHRVLDALLVELKARGMERASDLLVTGCSAGTLNVILNIDYIREQMQTSTKVRGLVQSSLFQDLHDADGSKQSARMQFQLLFNLMGMDSSGVVNPNCRDAFAAEPWKCIIAEYAAQFTKTPLFFMNSLWDEFSLTHLVNVPKRCMFGVTKALPAAAMCSKNELTSVRELRESTAATAVRAAASNPSTGYMLHSCVDHCGAMPRWTQLTVNGRTFRDAFESWYFSGERIVLEDVHGPNANPTCPEPVPEDVLPRPEAKYEIDAHIQPSVGSGAPLFLIGAVAIGALFVSFASRRVMSRRCFQMPSRQPAELLTCDDHGVE